MVRPSPSTTPAAATPYRLGAAKSLAKTRALANIRDWTRARFALTDEETALATELSCALPGCAPIETLVAFWTADGKRRHFKIFKRAEDVVEDDLPPSWMKPALADDEGAGCDCC